MCDQVAVSWQMLQKFTVVFLGVPRCCRETSRLFTCRFVHFWRSIKVLFLLICLCPGWIWDPEADSIFTAGFPQVIIYETSVIAAPAFTELSSLNSQHGKLTPPAQHFGAASPPSFGQHPPLLQWVRVAGWLCPDKNKADTQGGTLYPPGICNCVWPGAPTARTAVDALGERHRLATKRKAGLFVFTLLQGSPSAASRCKAVQSAAEWLSLGAVGLWLCATASCSSVLADRTMHCHHILTTRVLTQSHAAGVEQGFQAQLPDQKIQIHVQDQSMGVMAFSHHSTIRLRGGTLETLSKLRGVMRAGEPLHISWEHADTVFGMSWLEQILWYQGWEAGRWQVGKVPPLHLYTFKFFICHCVSPCVTEGFWLLTAWRGLLHGKAASSTACSGRTDFSMEH